MSLTIMEVLHNAEINLRPQTLFLAKEQLQNAIKLLEKGYDVYTSFTDLIDEYGSVDSVPEIDD